MVGGLPRGLQPHGLWYRTWQKVDFTAQVAEQLGLYSLALKTYTDYREMF